MVDYARPDKVEDALALLAAGNWAVLAGGTDYYPGLRDGVPITPVLDITAVNGLRQIVKEDGFWSIGALATWTDVIKASLPPAFDGLKLAAREVGSVQIQNRATIVGNLCNASPAADGVPPLLTLDALVEIASVAGRRRVPLSRFILGNRETDLRPDELVTCFLVPESSAKGSSVFLKLGARKYLVISISMVAARIVLGDGARISTAAVSVGACSAVARRLSALEGELTGARVDTIDDLKLSAAHLRDLQPIDDVRSTARYRMDASFELVGRAIVSAVEGAR